MYSNRLRHPLRPDGSSDRFRFVARWKSQRFAGALPSQAMKAGLARWPQRKALIFGGCTGEISDHCAELELRVSLNQGRSWPHMKTIFPGALACERCNAPVVERFRPDGL